MAERPVKKPGTPRPTTEEQLEQAKIAFQIGMLEKADTFVDLDNNINRSMDKLVACLVAEVERDPAAAFSHRGGAIDALASALREKPEGSTGVSGADIFGGQTTVQDIIDLITSLGGGQLLKDEKNFFLAIIRLIFCGC